MTTLILAACALACPVVMVGMMLFMRGHHRGSDRPPGDGE
jgi:hypothetical protein